MKDTDTLHEKDKAARRFWDDSDERPGVNRPKERCSCSGCGLAKYYPPLLTMSTVMAGVFCWLYVTKPVMITRTVAPMEGVTSSLLVSDSPDENGDVTVREPVVAVAPALDPGLGFLPGEEIAGPVQFAENVPGQDQQPVRIKRNAKPLFEPLPPEEVGKNEESMDVELALVAEKAVVVRESPLHAEEESGDEIPGEENSGLLGGEEVEASAEAIPTDASVAPESWPKGTTHEVAISLMGELVADALHDEAIIALSIEE